MVEWLYELETTVKQLRLVVGTRLEPATSGFQVRRHNHSTTMPPILAQRFGNLNMLLISWLQQLVHSAVLTAV